MGTSVQDLGLIYRICHVLLLVEKQYKLSDLTTSTKGFSYF
jgi:hypothetical protein